MKVSFAVSLTLLALASTNGRAQVLPAPTPKGVPVPSTTLTTATPSAVKLLIGGPAQTVMLTGTLLDKITAAYAANSNGGRMTTIQAAVLPATGATQRQIVLTAASSAQPNAQPSTLSVVVLARIGSTALLLDTIKVPLQLSLVAQSVLVHRDQLFGTSLASVFQGASSSFTSCGVPADHVFSVTLPNAPYGVTGTVARLERQTTVAERAEFLRTHSINPTSVFNPSAFASFGTTAHPSPFPHSVSDVRMCLETAKDGNWTFTSATQTAGAAQINISIKFSNAVFRARGMPSDPLGAFTALNVGIGWGDGITDKELPDYTYAIPEYKLLLPVTISNGQISYGAVQYTLAQQVVGWGGPFLGPGSSRTQMEQYAAARMTQIGQEIKKALESGNVRAALTNRIANGLQASYGITNVVGLNLTTGDMWEVQYK